MTDLKKHYLVVQCARCQRFLLAISTNRTRTCPYCGKRLRMKDARIVARSDTAGEVRTVLQKLKAEGDSAKAT